MTRTVQFDGMKIVYVVFGIIVLSGYSQADLDDFGYNVGQSDIRYDNDTAELTCFVSKTTFPVQWNKIDLYGVNDPIEISNGPTLIIKDSRFSLHIHTSGLLHTLKIVNTKEKDAGFYQCLVAPSYGRPLTSVKELQVSRPANIFDITIRSLLYEEGEEMILGCYATGHPIPKLSWRRQNNKIFPTGELIYSGNVYTIPNITKNDRGTYYCIAENGIGTPDIRNIGVEVKYLPVVNITTPELVVLYNDTVISCKAEAFPLPVITWIKDKVQLLNTEHYIISQVATKDKVIISTIHVINPEKENYGTYTCQASNERGTANDTIKILGFETY